MKDQFYISKSGEVRWNKFPEEPKWSEFQDKETGHSFPKSYMSAMEDYRKALQAAKDSSVECADQLQVKQILFERFCIFPAEYKDRLDSLHPFPSEQYEVITMDAQVARSLCYGDKTLPLKGKVAVIFPKKEPVLNEGKGEDTSHGIAIKFSEIFQNHYPAKPIWKMMDDLRKDIDSLVQSRISALEKENAALKKRLIELGDVSPF